MAILDIFKKKKTDKLEKKKVKKIVKEVKKEKQERKTIKEELPKAKKTVKVGEAYRILKTPHVAEKASGLAEKNQYTFRVFSRANKTDIKKAIEDTYGVNVISVKIINVSAKERRLGKTKGTKPGYKKAIVKVQKDQKIELLPR